MGFSRSPAGALSELQQNQQDAPGQRSPRKTRDDRPPGSSDDRGRSPTKSAFSTLSRIANIDPTRYAKSRETSPDKPKKTKSTTNLVGLLSRPKSSKSLSKQAKDDESQAIRDKENRTPPASHSSSTDLGAPPTPIYAQFSSQEFNQRLAGKGSSFDLSTPKETETTQQQPSSGRVKERPKSFHPHMMPPPMAAKQPPRSRDDGILSSVTKYADKLHGQASSERITSKAQRPKIFTAFSSSGSGGGGSSAKGSAENPEGPIDPKDIAAYLEDMLDRRNIPENQRFKMRNLSDTIKMEFIRQDWAEMAAKATADKPNPGNNSASSIEGVSSAVGAGTDDDDSHPKRSRGRSFTLGRSKKDSKLNTKKSKGEGTLGRHFRTKSTESIVGGERPRSTSGSIAPSGFLAKINKIGQGPGDFVAYLKKAQQPALVEVGKLHKLRLLLRNETVSWAEDFIRQGGMEEIVGLLNRILKVEWREEHEDALLHENLLCLKALCTTALALQYLDSIHTDLFPKMIHMLFDPEKKGPSEFTTRNIVTSILFTYIEAASPQERVIRAKTLLSFLRNPQPKEEERPVPFVLEMHKERPYTVWNKEVVNVTKEVFWIFLHNLNVIAMPEGYSSKGGALLESVVSASASVQQPYAYMQKHFPKPPPPVPAAPYVGGVEWDATNYLASHLDLVNAIMACTPTATQRNALRSEMRVSGWERCLGGSLRLCKEKFYGCVHEALRTWVAAAAEDGWDVRDVRYGPAPDPSRSSPKRRPAPPKTADGAAKEAAPKIEMPKLDFGLPSPDLSRGSPQRKKSDDWLS
ncbi:armadillo-type protein [Plectosphaerella plurivora]|uniref:Armadillo-type protein n=1 Tax=Plectosphaerella plurivora TaxID=936078 RepID=A0A9P8V6W8_9PEZI|nr:armadillo-type protein [Plectosphaerella plurivora]